MKAKKDEMDVALNTVVRVPRNTGLEQHLLQRRNLLMRPRLASYPAVRNIPFGVRGRRRNRRLMTVMFIGVQPNPDHLVQTPPSQVRPAPWVPARNPTPAPACRRLLFPPSPDQNVLASETAAEDSLIDFSFTENFGQLSLDSN